MTNAIVRFSSYLSPSDPDINPVLIVGQLKNLLKICYKDVKAKFGNKVSEETFNLAISGLRPSPSDSCSLYLNLAKVAALTIKCSRHNTPSQAHALTKVICNHLCGGNESVVIVCEKSDILASACAIARACPLFTRKSSNNPRRKISVEFLPVGLRGVDECVSEEDIECVTDAAYGVRLAARLTDTPCSEMNTSKFIKEVLAVSDSLKTEATVIKGDELKEMGFGGLYAVGMAAVHKSGLVVLSHKPKDAVKTVAWVGKGIVYDTGGLSIKGKTAMPGMKRDCGGAAAVLGSFYLAVKQGFKENLHAVFCLAENAVGPEALRPDDIITMYSGRTVEVNNTDAEGRLVLGDGVAYANKVLNADVIVDIATLTGAQGIATGRYHGALLTNSEEWEAYCCHVGRQTGDLLHPLIYAPELHFSEFSSSVADMKNSSADRSNAEVSCAGLFIGSHLGFDFPGTWIHIDMAYPMHSGERATGYGVALLTGIFCQYSQSTLLRNLAPPLHTGEDHLTNHSQTANKKIRLE